MNALLTSVAVAALLVVSGCDRQAPQLGTRAPAGSSVKIVSITPSVGEVLKVGDKVALKVDVEYTMTAESGTLGLVVQAADNATITQNVEVVLKGSNKISLVADFNVPPTKAIQIFTPLSAQGQASTSTVDICSYKVVTK
jgi:hypothetical protein